MNDRLNVFVYGTLKPGEVNDWLYAEHEVKACPAIVYGQLYALPLGYPAMTLSPPPSLSPSSSPPIVHGFLLTFASAGILPILDEFEQHDPEELKRHAPGQPPEQNQYERHLVEVFDPQHSPLGLAWSYTMTPKQIYRLGGVLVPDGKWNSCNS
ncbi:gamma-glutamylcyclotransferase [Kovacikia minuta CCNUW1]|uniref:gamma-glutamylcyclotransferase family protein n=1 Tax=Kovacikia minuta TaxID=2931930 RepID=UPI001CC92BCB|nr:gamma-glutamylcyclotransferase [Kovacikia minuta]UBF27838.1 gamma-glutamylcyclotransferase [Kovacikia minuta CCNUW1]